MPLKEEKKKKKERTILSNEQDTIEHSEDISKFTKCYIKSFSWNIFKVHLLFSHIIIIIVMSCC